MSKAVGFTKYTKHSFEWESDNIEVTVPAQTGWINSLGHHGNKVSTTIYISCSHANDDL